MRRVVTLVRFDPDGADVTLDFEVVCDKRGGSAGQSHHRQAD